jgi:hypothetical protein
MSRFVFACAFILISLRAEIVDALEPLEISTKIGECRQITKDIDPTLLTEKLEQILGDLRTRVRGGNIYEIVGAHNRVVEFEVKAKRAVTSLTEQCLIRINDKTGEVTSELHAEAESTYLEGKLPQDERDEDFKVLSRAIADLAHYQNALRQIREDDHLKEARKIALR